MRQQHRFVVRPVSIRDVVWLLLVAFVATVAVRMTPATSLPAPLLALVHTARPAPCAPMRVAVNPAGASADQLRLLGDAMARWSATGLVSLVDVGVTDLTPQTGDVGRWDLPGDPDVVVAFADPTTSDLFASGLTAERLSTDSWVVAGAAEPGVSRAGRPAASIVFNVAWLETVPDGYGPGTVGAVFLHELGHALGLRHAPLPTSVMFAAVDSGAGEITSDDVAALGRLVSTCGATP